MGKLPLATWGIASVFYGRWLSLSARWMFVFWIAYQFLIVWMQTQGVTNISGAAHHGGVLADLLFWLSTRDWNAGTREGRESSRGSIFER